MLAGRRIVLGVSGGIAAYKSAYLCRRLREEGAQVRVVMTAEAKNFVGAQTFAALSEYPVADDLFGHDLISPHTELARWAELTVVAPATAATLARLARGLSDEVLAATVIAAKTPVLLAPAMHTEMWEHPAVVENVSTLIGFGYHTVGPNSGALAGGDDGPGRMAEPEEILAAIEQLLEAPLRGVRVLVTAGGTREAIDPVRYVGNRSSGKMGHALANEAARRGAEVTLVTTSELSVVADVKVVEVESAEEMASAVAGVEADVVVLAAAVADFRPVRAQTTKLARAEGPPELRLESTPDILATVAKRQPRPYLVGFAAETGNLDRAVEKAQAKKVDLMVANDVTEVGAGFGTDTNRVMLIWPDGQTENWEMLTKTEVASRLWDTIAQQHLQ
jgi:phosphopantothenoylcysteine decarboxylase / phosphopantothenate---cysteine ligase